MSASDCVVIINRSTPKTVSLKLYSTLMSLNLRTMLLPVDLGLALPKPRSPVSTQIFVVTIVKKTSSTLVLSTQFSS